MKRKVCSIFLKIKMQQGTWQFLPGKIFKSSSPIPPVGKGLLLLTPEKKKKKEIRFVDVIACQCDESSASPLERHLLGPYTQLTNCGQAALIGRNDFLFLKNSVLCFHILSLALLYVNWKPRRTFYQNHVASMGTSLALIQRVHVICWPCVIAQELLPRT